MSLLLERSTSVIPRQPVCSVRSSGRLFGEGYTTVQSLTPVASLNRPTEYRVSQIAANLERHRWLPRERGDRYVLVNIPAFRLRAFDGGREVLSMHVVVGAEYGGRTTPVFSDSMAYVVFRPYWNVPSGIAARELWPRQQRDPSYFRRAGYEIVHANWGDICPSEAWSWKRAWICKIHLPE